MNREFDPRPMWYRNFWARTIRKYHATCPEFWRGTQLHGYADYLMMCTFLWVFPDPFKRIIAAQTASTLALIKAITTTYKRKEPK